MTQKTFIRAMEFMKWKPKIKYMQMYLDGRPVKYILTFAEHENHECICSQKHALEILKNERI